MLPDTKRILHVVPDSAADSRQLYLGSTKDILGRTEYFQARGVQFDQVTAENRSDVVLVRTLQGMELDGYDAVLFEYPVYPRSIRYLRNRYVDLKILVRAHHAEFYHRLHYALARAQNSYGWLSLRGHFRSLRYSLVRLRLDYLCAKLADSILSISEWEARNYWRFLTSIDKVSNVPYFLPSSYREQVPSSVEKKTQCVCLMSTTPGTLPFMLDAASNFSRLVEMLGQERGEWSFFITGDISNNTLSLAQRVAPTGLLESPYGILAESRAVALLSDYGFGFKTKILEAIDCGSYVLVTRRLFGRLPNELQPYCIVVDPSSIESFEDALEQCTRPFPEGDPNSVLRRQAFAALDSLMFDPEDARRLAGVA